MSMMRHSVALAVAMANMAGLAAASPQMFGRGPTSESNPRAHTATNGAVHHQRRRGKGWSFAQVKRMKRKRRNRLRAKGRFRKAVR